MLRVGPRAGELAEAGTLLFQIDRGPDACGSRRVNAESDSISFTALLAGRESLESELAALAGT